jgi:hypothetical protein
MRDKDTLILENLYVNMLFEFTEKTIQKLIAKFQKESPNLSETIIKSYLDRFEKVKSSPKVKKKDPFQYKWKELENFLDANFPSEDEKVSSDDDEKEQLKVYEDDDVAVYRATNIRQAQILGKGYTFCISRIGSGNMYSYYRLNYQSSFYFVRFKNKSDKKTNNYFEDPFHYIVLDFTPDGRIMMTGADNGSQGNGTKYISEEKLFEKFPILGDLNEKNLFETAPLTKEEREKYDKFKYLEQKTSGNISDTAFKKDFEELKFSEKKEYLQAGYLFPPDLFEILDKSLRADYLNNGPSLNEKGIKSLSESEKKRWVITVLRKHENTDSEEQSIKYLISHLTTRDKDSEWYETKRKPLPDVLLNATIGFVEGGKFFRDPEYFIVNIAPGEQRDKIWMARISNGRYLTDKESALVEQYLPKIYEQYLSIIDVNAKLRLANSNFDNMENEELNYILNNKLASDEQLIHIVGANILPNGFPEIAAKIMSKMDYKNNIQNIIDLFDQQTLKYENGRIYFDEYQGDYGSFLQDIQDYVDQDDYKHYLKYYVGDEYVDMDVRLDTDAIETLLDELQRRRPDLYKRLDAHLRLLYKEHNETTAEEDGLDLEDLVYLDLDNEIRSTFYRSYISALESGAMDAISKEFQSFIKDLPFYFDEGEGGSIRLYLSPDQFYEILIVSESIDALYNGENILQIFKVEGEFPKFDVPYYGFDGYNEDAAMDVLRDELEHLLP